MYLDIQRFSKISFVNISVFGAFIKRPWGVLDNYRNNDVYPTDSVCLFFSI